MTPAEQKLMLLCMHVYDRLSGGHPYEGFYSLILGPQALCQSYRQPATVGHFFPAIAKANYIPFSPSILLRPSMQQAYWIPVAYR